MLTINLEKARKPPGIRLISVPSFFIRVYKQGTRNATHARRRDAEKSVEILIDP